MRSHCPCRSISVKGGAGMNTSEAVPNERECLVYRAFGGHEACPGDACIFHRVPGVEGCAVRKWAPDAAESRVTAAWFLARRLEAESARRERDARFGRPKAGAASQRG